MTEQMQPGRELDRLVAEVIGELMSSHPGFYWQEYATESGDGGDGFSCPRCGKSVSDPDESTEGDCYKSYSTHIEDAMEAWAWLEENHTWGLIVLGRVDDGKPAVLEIITGSQFEGCSIEPIAVGDTYPHAIALAVKIKKEVMRK